MKQRVTRRRKSVVGVPAHEGLMIGVNLAVGEFNGQQIPGRLHFDYDYPNNQEVDYYAAKGMAVIRLPFLIERLQESKNGGLRSEDLGIIKSLVSYANSKNMIVLLDAHNYGSMFGGLINNASMYSAFADFWGKMSAQFKSANVWFGLMNEPYQQSAEEWLPAINQAVAAIRNASANQLILASGTYWDGAWTWVSSDNDTVIGAPGQIKDPKNNTIFEVHQYMDSDGSGSHDTVVSGTVGSERLAEITQWAKSRNPPAQLWLGESGVATNSTALACLDDMVKFMQANSDVWAGISYWAGGPWWGPYMFTIEPNGLGTANVQDQPQMDVLEPYITGGGGDGGDGSTTITGSVTVTAAGGVQDSESFTVTATVDSPPDTVTINSCVVDPASAPAGTQRTLTAAASSSSGSALTWGAPVADGIVFTEVPGQPAGTAKWSFTY